MELLFISVDIVFSVTLGAFFTDHVRSVASTTKFFFPPILLGNFKLKALADVRNCRRRLNLLLIELLIDCSEGTVNGWMVSFRFEDLQSLPTLLAFLVEVTIDELLLPLILNFFCGRLTELLSFIGLKPLFRIALSADENSALICYYDLAGEQRVVIVALAENFTCAILSEHQPTNKLGVHNVKDQHDKLAVGCANLHEVARVIVDAGLLVENYPLK